MGMAIGVAPEDWVFDEPDKVRGLHAAFIDAGADIILTDTFGGTSLRLRESRYAGRATELNRRAAELARQASAARDGILVAGSMGPTGMLMEPLGELTTPPLPMPIASRPPRSTRVASICSCWRRSPRWTRRWRPSKGFGAPARCRSPSLSVS